LPIYQENDGGANNTFDAYASQSQSEAAWLTCAGQGGYWVVSRAIGQQMAKSGIIDSKTNYYDNERQKMEIHELIVEMKLLERRLTLYEEKYGVLSEDFYAALTAGELERYDAFDETRADFSRWKGIYETWLRRKEAYTAQMRHRELAETLRVQPVY